MRQFTLPEPEALVWRKPLLPRTQAELASDTQASRAAQRRFLFFQSTGLENTGRWRLSPLRGDDSTLPTAF